MPADRHQRRRCCGRAFARVLAALALWFGLSALPLTAAEPEAEPLRGAAAADLRRAFAPLRAGFLRQHPGSAIEPIFGASGKLAAQIEHGAPFDVLLAADESYPARLHQLGLT